jgi:hypothetical protein
MGIPDRRPQRQVTQDQVEPGGLNLGEVRTISVLDSSSAATA